ncbi:MAG TPA: TrkH family potassium uptake protein [Syntrophales bacterium]|nr:TrkH family potassium uptake protein [Syntrophales bacterium]
MASLTERIKRLPARILTPSRIFMLSFAVVILIGALLLYLPLSYNQKSLSFVDALFTSASAVCVTGLAVVDLGEDLSLTGQIITLLLLQVGGLGIITFSVIFFGLMGKGISFKEREIAQSTFLHTPRRDFLVIIKWVFISTLIIESLGTLILFVRFLADYPVGRAFYLGLYHAVSAFNNCGYSLFSNNMMSYQGDWTINVTMMLLIILGGIGFVVHYELYQKIRGRQKRLSLHSKIVLFTTGALILGGATFFYLFEMNQTIKNMPLSTGILASFFQSITARTSGFNTVDISGLTNATLLLLIILMFIGASPGSTGGGIKTTSFALLMMMIWNRLRGSEQVNLYSRTVPGEILTRTLAIIFTSALFVFVITSVLLLWNNETGLPPTQTRQLFVEYLFETVSAFGTVGLSMNVTPKLNDVQKLAVIIMMFAGRVGPLTLAFSWYSRRKKGLTYAEESMMVG